MLTSFRIDEEYEVSIVADGERVGNPIAVAEGNNDRLFVAQSYKDESGLRYRIRVLAAEGKSSRYTRWLRDIELDQPFGGMAAAERGIFVACGNQIRSVQFEEDGIATEKILYSSSGQSPDFHDLQWGHDGCIYARVESSCEIRGEQLTQPTQVTAGIIRLSPMGTMAGMFSRIDNIESFVLSATGEPLVTMKDRPVLQALRVNPICDVAPIGTRGNELSETAPPFLPFVLTSEMNGSKASFAPASQQLRPHSPFILPAHGNDPIKLLWIDHETRCLRINRFMNDPAPFFDNESDASRVFLGSQSQWFSPVGLHQDARGELLIVDRTSLHSEGQSPFGGRIWRVSRRQFPKPDVPSPKTVGDAIRMIDSSSPSERHLATRFLTQNFDGESAAKIQNAFRSLETPTARIVALSFLTDSNHVTEDIWLEALSDHESQARIAAIRLLRKSDLTVSSIRNACEKLIEDPNPWVRLQAASIIDAKTSELTLDSLAKISMRDADHPWFRVVVGAGLEGRESILIRSWLAAPRVSRGVITLAGQLAERAAALRDIEQLRAILDSLATRGDNADPISISVMEGAGLGAESGETPIASALSREMAPLLVDRHEMVAVASLAFAVRMGAEDEAPVQEAIRRAIEFSTNPLENTERRVMRIDAIRGADAKLLGDLESLVSHKHPLEIQAAATHTLSEAGTAGLTFLVGRMNNSTPAAFSEILESVVAHSEGRAILFDAIERGEISPDRLKHFREELLAFCHGPELDRLSALFDRVPQETLPVAQDVLARVNAHKRNEQAHNEGIKKGEIVFGKHCSHCHVFNGVGRTLGPDLTAPEGRDAKRLLETLLAIRKESVPAYVPYRIADQSGRTRRGLVMLESDREIAFNWVDSKPTSLARSKIVEIVAENGTFMPNFSETLSADDLSAVIEFLTNSENHHESPRP